MSGLRIIAVIIAVISGIALVPAAVMWLFSLLAFGSAGGSGSPGWLGFVAVASIPTLLLLAFIVAIRCAIVPSGKLLAVAAGLALTAFAIPTVIAALLTSREPAQECFNDRYVDADGHYDPNRPPKPGPAKMVCRKLSRSGF